MLNSNNVVSITEANENFSKVTKLVDANGSVVISKDNITKYLVIEINKTEKFETASDDEVDAISNSKMLIGKNREAYEAFL